MRHVSRTTYIRSRLLVSVRHRIWQSGVAALAGAFLAWVIDPTRDAAAVLAALACGLFWTAFLVASAYRRHAAAFDERLAGQDGGPDPRMRR